ncbi:hypothetical protein ACFWWM_00195 [Streptomyces sp. NPDC058682]|uniref:hypothetical protein n=1 Tax=Streptomyces sp. NPDC058682 TaxID=3346596 RepID=UPI0036647806
MSQVTTAARSYTFTYAEDIPSETFIFSGDVDRTPELDDIANAYMNAKIALYAAVNPGRVLNARTLDYAGYVVVSETTAEGARLYPTHI